MGRTTRSDQVRGRAARDNRCVADHTDLTRPDGRPVCRCREADSFGSRFRGLMGVAELPPGTGLLLPRAGRGVPSTAVVVIASR